MISLTRHNEKATFQRVRRWASTAAWSPGAAERRGPPPPWLRPTLSSGRPSWPLKSWCGPFLYPVNRPRCRDPWRSGLAREVDHISLSTKQVFLNHPVQALTVSASYNVAGWTLLSLIFPLYPSTTRAAMWKERERGPDYECSCGPSTTTTFFLSSFLSRANMYVEVFMWGAQVCQKPWWPICLHTVHFCSVLRERTWVIYCGS